MRASSVLLRILLLEQLLCLVYGAATTTTQAGQPTAQIEKLALQQQQQPKPEREQAQQQEIQQEQQRPRTVKKPKEPLLYESHDLHKLAGNDKWMSFHDKLDFLPNSNLNELSDEQIRKWAQRHLESNNADIKDYNGNDDVYRISPFVEGESDYDEYQTAWRLLGFMIDCDDDLSDRDDDAWYGNNEQHNSGSGDEGTGEMCNRYVIWAAYVDLYYEGGGLGEYQYWDKYSQKWNTNTCNYVDGEYRCARMDCHEEGTHWRLLGMFKHKSLDDWMEQLFKHEGVCVWTEDEYDFMADAREAWPDGCIASGTTTDKGDYIYYAVKPIENGRITIGLYTDTRCVEEYKSQGNDDPITIDNVVGNIFADGGGSGSGDNNRDYDGETFEDTLADWDDALQTFRVCQPCVAYDLNNVGYNTDDDSMKGSSYGTYRYGYDDDYTFNYYYQNGQIQGADFDCYDDADYTNVNQCMKFMAKTEMNTASFRDFLLAKSQNTLVSNPLESWMDSNNQGWFKRRKNSTSAFGMWFWFICSVALALYGYVSFYRVQKNTGYKLPKFQMNLKEPLVYA